MKNDGYFTWLCNKISDYPAFDVKDYKSLLKMLWRCDFVVRHEFDANRAADGLALREGAFISDRGASILEVMVALTIKVNSGMENGWLFFQCLRNLGISFYDEHYFEKHGQAECVEEVSKVLSRFNNLEYDPKGNGGLFVSYRDGDLREMEIAEQYERFYRDFIRPYANY